MKKKLNPELLKEELKKFKLLSEYDFYQEKKEEPEYKSLDEDDEEPPSDLEPDDSGTDTDTAAANVASDLGVDSDNETNGDIPEPDLEEPEQAPAATAPIQQPASENNDIEVDVTSLVKGSEEAKHSADIAGKNSQILLHKLNNLEARIANMANISNKIEDLEKELIKRNPTPVEKLEMRSLSSYPYSQKLTDYWADKEGPYNVMGTNQKEKEYTLTKDDVDSGYNDLSIKKTFGVKDEYDEEEI